MIKLIADSPLPTTFGDFHMYLFVDQQSNKEHIVLAFGNIEKGKKILVRIHSACVTSEIFRATNCDCKEQLDHALQSIANYGVGALVYLNQEGRGNGLEAKLKSLNLIVTEQISPNAAFKRLGYSEDLRDYNVAAEMLKILTPDCKIILLTNNPRKIEELKKSGIEIVEIMESYIEPQNDLMRINYEAKRDELGHFFSDKTKKG